jgi:hypothetical protein
MPTPNYANGLIYKLVHKEDYDNVNIYIGSTTNFRGRKGSHKCHCTNINDNCYNQEKYQIIRDNGGWDCWEMIQIEAFPCTTKRELETQERYWIELMKSKLNGTMPTRTNNERINENREEYLEKRKLNYVNNKEILLEKSKKYNKEQRINNPEKTKLKDKEEYEKRKENQKIKTICECCQREIRKIDLKRHQTSLICIKAKEAL